MLEVARVGSNTLAVALRNKNVMRRSDIGCSLDE